MFHQRFIFEIKIEKNNLCLERKNEAKKVHYKNSNLLDDFHE